MIIMVDYNLLNTRCIHLIPFLVERMKLSINFIMFVMGDDVSLMSGDCLLWVVLFLVEIDNACWFDDLSLVFPICALVMVYCL